MKSELVSIVIPTYNRSQDLIRVLESLKAQTYSKWEAIIVDNHSQDDTDQVIESFKSTNPNLSINLFKIHNEGVIAASRNLGLSKVSGEYIALLDSDDWWTFDKLEKCVQELKNGADFTYHSMYLVKDERDLNNLPITKCRQLNTADSFKDLLQYGNTINNSSVLFKRHLFEKTGPLSTEKELIAIEDYDLWLRMAKLKANFKLMPETLGYYWIGGGNISNDERTIAITNALQDKYQQDIQNLGLKSSYTWFSFAKAKSYYRLKNFSKAKEELQKNHYQGCDILTYTKCHLLLTLSLFRSIFHS